ISHPPQQHTNLTPSNSILDPIRSNRGRPPCFQRIPRMRPPAPGCQNKLLLTSLFAKRNLRNESSMTASLPSSRTRVPDRFLQNEPKQSIVFNRRVSCSSFVFMRVHSEYQAKPG